MVNNNSFDNDLRNSFEGFEPEPPSDAWLAIQQAIVVAPQRTFLPVFFKVAAAIAFLAVSGLSVWFITSDNQADSQLAEVSTQLADEPVMDAEKGGFGSDRSQENLSPAVRQQSVQTHRPSSGDVRSAVNLASVSGENRQLPETPASFPGASGPDEQHILTSLMSQDIPELAFLSRIPITSLSLEQGMLAALKSKPLSQQSVAFASNPNAIQGYNLASRASTAGVVLGAHMAPQYADRYISGPLSNLPFGSLESQSMEYGFGFTVSVAVSKRLSVQTGLGYMNINQHINDISAFSHLDNRPFYDPEFSSGNGHPQNIVTSFGIIEMDSPLLYFADKLSSRVVMTDTKIPFDVPDDPKFLVLQGQDLTQYFRFVEVPLVLRYRFLDLRFASLSLKAGVAGNFLVRNDVIMSDIHNHEEVIGETYGVRDFSYSGIGGLAVTFPLTNRLHIFVEPTAQMFLQPIAKDNALPLEGNASYATGKTYPYCFSVNSGISFRF